MTGTELQPLASALVAAVLGSTPSLDTQDDSPLAGAFEAASSLRVALPLGYSDAALVSTDLRSPAALSYSLTPLGATSLVGRTLATGRTGVLEGDGVAQLADTKQLSEGEGATSFLCVPVVPEPSLATDRAALAALLLSYPSTSAAPQGELRLALLLAAELSRRHSRELHTHIGRLQGAMNPSEHQPWGPGVGPEYAELSGSDSGSEDEFSGSASTSGSLSTASSLAAPLGSSSPAAAALLHGRLAEAAPPVASLSARCTMDPLTLRFADHKLERQFQAWRNSRLAKLLLLANRSHRWYSKHRDQLLMCTYVLLACHHALDLSSLAAAPGGMGQALALRVEASWCVVLGVILQVQFVGQCLMLAGSAVLKSLLQPGCMARLAGGHAAHLLHSRCGTIADSDCLLDCFGRSLLLKVVLPCTLAYVLELSARRTFCKCVSHTGVVRT
ncbi:hypothetical protein COHA_010058 [Chlorella ohadii]|uniref:Uncharacterized protein n=1 Tax=Chlorella ohadii TaxID=2649997 RepID=A0AAD5DH36_9CHLO|nr:hypothetical protein COHA_010058 [Chlorella ohadii]